MKAAELGTTVSALVKRFLTELAAGESDAEHLKREERSLRGAFRVADRLPHDDVQIAHRARHRYVAKNLANQL
jgi:hypothetical protein